MKYGIEIKVGENWKPVNPPAGPPPYSFKTRPEAETMARILYPAMVKKPNLLRIKEAP